jgi:hypothetical protein
MATLRRHLWDSWPDRVLDELAWPFGPVEEMLPGFRVCRVSPLVSGDSFTYLSIGAFAGDLAVKREFFILSPVDSIYQVETLAMVSHFHSFEQHRLAPGSVINIGRPWLEGAEAQHLLVVWPHMLDRRTATCLLGQDELIYLGLIPIFEAEAAFARAHGAGALEDRLEETQVSLTDPARPVVV